MEAGTRSVVENKTTGPRWICLPETEPRITEPRLNQFGSQSWNPRAVTQKTPALARGPAYRLWPPPYRKVTVQ